MSVVGMVPLWLFVACPFGVIKVFLLLRLVIRLVWCFVLVHGLVNWASVRPIIQILFDIITLSLYGVFENFVRFLHFLKHFSSLISVSVWNVGALEIWMVLLSHLIVGQLYLLLIGACLYIQYFIQILLLSSKVKEYRSRVNAHKKSLLNQMWFGKHVFYI